MIQESLKVILGVVISVEDSEFSKAKKILEKSGSEEIKEG